jgi:hypothetical protein
MLTDESWWSAMVEHQAFSVAVEAAGRSMSVTGHLVV